MWTGAPFNASVYTPFTTKVLQGLKLTSFFEYSTECTSQVFNLISQVYYVYKNGTCNVPQYDIRKMIYYTSQVIATEGSNSFYNCYLFSASVEKVVTTRLNTFMDFPDLYTSFLFNLLSNSLQIKTIATRIKTFSDGNNKPELYGELAKLIRITLDFESSNAAALKNESEAAQNNFKKSSLNIESNFLDKAINKLMKHKFEVSQ